MGPGEGRPEVVVLSRGDGLAGGADDFCSSRRALSDGWWAVQWGLTLRAAAAIIYKCGDNEASMLMWERVRRRGCWSSAVQVKAKRLHNALTKTHITPPQYLRLGKMHSKKWLLFKRFCRFHQVKFAFLRPLRMKFLIYVR